jgi:hypothetical protein
LRDISAIMQVGGAEIDIDYISRWSDELGLTDSWRAVVERLRNTGGAG